MIVPPVAALAVIYGRYVHSISKQTQDALAKATEVRTSNLCTFNLGAIILLAQDYFIGIFLSGFDSEKSLTTSATHLHLYSNVSLDSWTDIYSYIVHNMQIITQCLISSVFKKFCSVCGFQLLNMEIMIASSKKMQISILFLI